MNSNTNQFALTTAGLNSDGSYPFMNCEGMATASIQVFGTISANYFTIEGRVGETFVVIPLVNVLSTGAALASGHIVAAGIYRINCAGLREFQLKAHASLAGTGLSASLHVSDAISVAVAAT